MSKFLQSIKELNTARVKELIAEGETFTWNPEWDSLPDHFADFFRDAIHNDEKEVLEFFLDTGLPVDCRNGIHYTLLIIASTYGQFEIMKMLVERGADVNATAKREGILTNGLNFTPLECTASTGSLDAVKLLIEHGARPDIKNSPFNTSLLMRAAAYNTKEVFEYLYSLGLEDINHQNAVGETALMWMARRIRNYGFFMMREYLLFLLEAGADYTLKNDKGETASDYASEATKDFMEKWIIQHNQKELDNTVEFSESDITTI